MKRTLIILAVVLFLIFIAGCASSDPLYTVRKDGVTYTVDQVNGTIYDGTYTYHYTFSGDSSSYRIRITYPDGSRYDWNHTGSFGHGGWMGDLYTDYSEQPYAEGDILCDIIAEQASDPADPGAVFLALFLLAVGVFHIAAPQTAWYLAHGWRYKDAEPSELALGVNRFSGVVAVIAGICMIIFS